ncbi:MAG: type I-F CRISPR-associated protein Csy3 [Lysobacterales bacterium]
MSKNTTLTTATVLAFERKLDPSDAVFYAGRWDQRDDSTLWSPIKIREKSVRGTISNRLKTKDADPAKLDAAIENPNLQTVDVAALPTGSDTLMARFTLRVLGGCGEPSACNNADYREKLLSLVGGYSAQHRFATLAHRYASNIANARFLWRNRICAEAVEVRVRHLKDGDAAGTWTFASLELPVDGFDQRSADLDALAATIDGGLSGAGYVLLEVTAFARMGEGQEVFPSQELILDKGNSTKSKTLYDVGGVAGMHSQKIGNALRTIDTWYPQSEQTGPIAVEPYGSVTSLGKAFRQPKEGRDFYSLLDGWMLKDKVPDEGDQHYVMATLIRGGVFGASGKE